MREFDSEEDSYIPMEELRQDKEKWKAWIAEEQATNRDAFLAECVSGLTDIINGHGGQTVAVVCHGGVINAWASTTLGLGGNMFFEPDYTSIHRFMASSKGHRTLRLFERNRPPSPRSRSPALMIHP